MSTYPFVLCRVFFPDDMAPHIGNFQLLYYFPSAFCYLWLRPTFALPKSHAINSMHLGQRGLSQISILALVVTLLQVCIHWCCSPSLVSCLYGCLNKCIQECLKTLMQIWINVKQLLFLLLVLLFVLFSAGKLG